MHGNPLITSVGVVHGVHLHEPIHHGTEAASIRVLAVAFEREAARAVRRAMHAVLREHFREAAGYSAPLPTLECGDGRCIVVFAAEHAPAVCDVAGRRLRGGVRLAEGTQVRLRAHLLPMRSGPGLVPLLSVVQIVREVDDELLMPPYDQLA